MAMKVENNGAIMAAYNRETSAKIESEMAMASKWRNGGENNQQWRRRGEIAKYGMAI